MRRHITVVFTIVLLVLLLGLLPTACSGAKDETAVPTTEQEVSPAVVLDGVSLLEERCTECHDRGRVERTTKTEEEWETTVRRMVEKGTVLSQAEQELIIQYLAETYPQ